MKIKTEKDSAQILRRNILLISDHGRRQESLAAILRSAPGGPEIICAEASASVECTLTTYSPSLVIIDYASKLDRAEGMIEIIRSLDEEVWILLIVAHPKLAVALSRAQPDAILCDGFSSSQLQSEIQKGMRSAQKILPDRQVLK